MGKPKIYLGLIITPGFGLIITPGFGLIITPGFEATEFFSCLDMS